MHGEVDSVVSRVYAERAARVLSGLHVPVTLDIVEDLGHALSQRAISLGSLRLLQGMQVRDLKLRSIDRTEYFRPSKTR